MREPQEGSDLGNLQGTVERDGGVVAEREAMTLSHTQYNTGEFHPNPTFQKYLQTT
jgi:hypothetical protein